MLTYINHPFHCVILGAGAAGTLLALELAKGTPPDFHITLIDNKDFHEYTPSIINVLLQPTVFEMRKRLFKVCPLLSDMFKGTRVEIIKGVVESVTSNEVILKTARVPYSLLAICTGSSYSAPYKLPLNIENIEQRFEALLDSRTKIESAESLLCIGGGPVGVEMAGELASRYPRKRVTLVHSQPKLIEKLPASLGCSAKANLEESSNNHGPVNVILDQKAEPQKDGESTTYVTSKSQQVLRPDHVIMSSGISPNSQFMAENFAHCLDERNFIKVDDLFRVCGQPHIFAIGDVCNNPDPKLYFTAHMQAMHLSKNLKAELFGRRPTPYRGSRVSYAVSLGPELGLVSFADGFVNIRGLRSLLFNRSQRGSRLAIFIKLLIEKVSLCGSIASITNRFLYSISTR